MFILWASIEWWWCAKLFFRMSSSKLDGQMKSDYSFLMMSWCPYRRPIHNWTSYITSMHCIHTEVEIFRIVVIVAYFYYWVLKITITLSKSTKNSVEKILDSGFIEFKCSHLPLTISHYHYFGCQVFLLACSFLCTIGTKNVNPKFFICHYNHLDI